MARGRVHWVPDGLSRGGIEAYRNVVKVGREGQTLGAGDLGLVAVIYAKSGPKSYLLTPEWDISVSF